jgi:putative mRNA 3-end processing factor
LEGIDAAFSKEEIEKTRNYTFQLSYNRNLDITEKVSLEFFDAGHILGSAICKLSWKKKALAYTGDFLEVETRMHKSADLKIGNADYLITETTYGNRNHPPRKETEKEFITTVRETLENKGTVLVPAFAVGRSQEILEILHAYKIDAPIYLDGMGKKAAQIALRYPAFVKNPKTLRKAMNNTRWIQGNQDRKQVLKEPSVVVTTAGMLEGGPIMHYLKRKHKDENSSVLLTGYQVKDTPGDRLLKENRIEVDGKTYDVKCFVKKFDFSAHASQNGLLKVIKACSPQKIFRSNGFLPTKSGNRARHSHGFPRTRKKNRAGLT